MQPTWADVDVILGRLHRLLPSRVGSVSAQLVLRNLISLRERGVAPLEVLHAAHQTLDAFADREALAAPFSSAVCRGIADAAPLKLSLLSSRISFQQPARGMAAVEHEGLATHAAALLPAFGDVDLCTGMAWKNALLYRLSLVVGEAWSRNDGTPLTDLFGAAADLRLPDDVVPIGLVRGQGVVVARGVLSSTSKEPFLVRSFSFQRFAGDPIVVDVGGGFAGVRELLALWALPITPATLPWIIGALLMPFGPAAAVVDDDHVIEAFVGGEDLLEQERFQGPLAALTRQKLGIAAVHVAGRALVRFRIERTTVTYRAGGDVDVD